MLKYAIPLGVLCLTLFATSIGAATHNGSYPADFRIPDATPTVGGPTLQPIEPENVTRISQLTAIPTSAPVMDVVWSPDGSLVALAEGSEIQLYGVSSLLTPKVILRGHTDTVNCIAFSPDGASIASGSDDSTVRIWDIGTGRQKVFQQAHSTYFGPAHAMPIYSVAFSPDGKFLAYGTEAIADVYVWDVQIGTVATFEDNPNGFIKTVIFSPDGSAILASGGNLSTILSWDMKTQKELPPIAAGHTGGIFKLAFDHSGTLLASASWDGTVRLWNIKLNKLQAVSPRFDDWVTDVSFSRDGKLVACASMGSVHLLDVESAGTVMTVASDVNPVTAVFNPGGTLLALASPTAKAVQLWGIK